jgi:hypothetical protein
MSADCHICDGLGRSIRRYAEMALAEADPQRKGLYTVANRLVNKDLARHREQSGCLKSGRDWQRTAKKQ